MGSVPRHNGGVNPCEFEGRSPPLGILANIVAAPTHVLGLAEAPNGDTVAFNVYERDDAVRRRFELQSTARELLPDYRVSNCLRVPVGSLVELYHHAEHSTASFGGLQTCGSVHVCSVCGSKVGQRRAEEVNAAATKWVTRGGVMMMATFTVQHSAEDSLADVAGALNSAYRTMRACRGWQGFERRHGLVGSITAREYTHGNHGWHAHLHALLFLDRPVTNRARLEISAYLRDRWGDAVEREGRYASPIYGTDCQLSNDGSLSAYISKAHAGWSVGDELAKSNRKKSKGGCSIPELLAAAGLGDVTAARLFQEYAAWTYRKNALVWSPGLRKLLGLSSVEKTDEELAQELQAKGVLILLFTRDQWRVVLANDARVDVLMVARTGDIDQVVTFLEEHFGVEIEAWQVEEAARVAAAEIV